MRIRSKLALSIFVCFFLSLLFSASVFAACYCFDATVTCSECSGVTGACYWYGEDYNNQEIHGVGIIGLTQSNSGNINPVKSYYTASGSCKNEKFLSTGNFSGQSCAVVTYACCEGSGDKKSTSGVWDESEEQCIECESTTKEQEIYGDTTDLYVGYQSCSEGICSTFSSSGLSGNYDCESACGADPGCDEKSTGSWGNIGDVNSACGDEPEAWKCDSFCNYLSKDCDKQDVCSGTCNPSSGDIEEKDYWADSNLECDFDWDAVIENCSYTATDGDNGKYATSASSCIEERLCSSGQITCPSTPYDDECTSSTQLTEYYVVDSTECRSTVYDCSDVEITATNEISKDYSTTKSCIHGSGATCNSIPDGDAFEVFEYQSSGVSEGCVDSSDCPGGSGCMFREAYAVDTDDACPGKDKCVNELVDPDTTSHTCGACGLHWNVGGLSSLDPEKCCGADSGE